MRREGKRTRRGLGVLAVAWAAAAALPTSDAGGASRFWVNGVLNGNWNNTANWSATLGGAGGATVPGAADFATIQQNDANNRNITLNVPATVIVFNVTNTGGGTNTFTQNGNNLTVSDGEFLGYNNNGRAVHTQTGGSSTFTNFLIVGQNAGANGTYNLSSGSVFVQSGATAFLRVGWGGTGAFNHSGGTVLIGTPAAPRRLEIGYSNGGNGTYNLSGPAGPGGTELIVNGQEFIGYNDSATGVFVQTGGTHSVTQTLSLGQFNGSSGSYDLSGGSLSTTTSFVGRHITDGGISSGSFTHSGGTHTASDLTVGSATTGGVTGTYTLSGTGSLTVTNTSSIGSGGGDVTATFNHTGGNHTTQFLDVGSNVASGDVDYNLSGTGNLTVTNETRIGNGTVADPTPATFAQSGGTHTTPTMTLGQAGHGKYVLSGGNLSVSGDETVGLSGFGEFEQTGGTHTVGGSLSFNSGSEGGTYHLSGTGNLVVGQSESINGTDGIFTQSGGTHTVGNAGVGLLSGLSVFGGQYNLSGGTLLAHGFLQVGGTVEHGTFNHTGGTFNIGTPGAQSLFVIAGNSNVGEEGTYNLSDTGVLNVNGDAHIGGITILDILSQPGGKGTVNISAGSMSVTGSLTLWEPNTQVTPPGTALNLSGGTLSVRSFEGSGNRFNWTGGTLNVTDPAGLVLGTAAFLPSLTLGAGKNLNVTALTVENGATLTLDGGGFTYSSALTMAGGAIDGSAALNNTKQISGFGTITGSGAFSNSGSVNVTSGTLSLIRGGAQSNSGTISIAPGAVLQLGLTSFANSGLINLGGGTIAGAGTLNNNAGGVISGNGTISPALVNNAGGTLLVQTGTLNGSAITNNGVIRGDGLVMNAVTNATTGEIRAEIGKWLTINAMPSANLGKINLQGGTAEFNAALTNAAGGLITGRGTLRANAGWTNNGQVQLSGGQGDYFGDLTNTSGSKVIITGAATGTFFDDLTSDAGSEFRVSTGATAVFFGSVSGSAAFTGAGTKIFEGGPPSILAAISSEIGDTVVSPSVVVTAGHVREDELEVYGLLTIPQNGLASGTSRVNRLMIDAAGGGKLDLKDNKMIVVAGELGLFTGVAYTGVAGLIDRGRGDAGNALWNGNGIITTDPRAISNGDLVSIGVASAGQLNRSSFGGLAVAPEDVLVMVTWGGDANLDGKINIDDYGRIDGNVGQSGSVFGWDKGDFNYDGKINIDDYGIIDGNINRQGAPFSTGGALEGVGADLGELGAVPEPSMVALALLTLGSLRRRRSRRRPAR